MTAFWILISTMMCCVYFVCLMVLVSVFSHSRISGLCQTSREAQCVSVRSSSSHRYVSPDVAKDKTQNLLARARPIQTDQAWDLSLYQHLNTLHVLWTRLASNGDRAFSNIAPRLWNSLPDYLRQIHNITLFQQKLKTHLFLLAFQHLGKTWPAPLNVFLFQ